MAKVIIEIEDMPDGKVKVSTSPSPQTIRAMVLSGGHDITDAHIYATRCMEAIKKYNNECAPGAQDNRLITL